MASKRYTPLDDPPTASSDDDETEDEQETIAQKAIDESSSGDEEENSDEEAPEPLKNTLEKPKIQNPNSKPADLSSEEESESDSEGEEGEAPPHVKLPVQKTKPVTPNSSSIFEFDSDVRSPTASDFAIKPSKKSNASESPEKTPTSKRRLSGSEVKGKKKIKVSNGDVDDEKKASKRVWSEDDELLLLQGFIDYQSKIGCSPLSEMDGFYMFTMNSLPGYASKSQLYEKIRRLKKKFRVNSEKATGNGEDPVFSKPHEHKIFELSNKIWGKGGCESVSAAGGTNSKGKTRVPKIKPIVEVKVDDEDDEKMAEDPQMEDFETLYPYWNAGLTSHVLSDLKCPDGIITLVKENMDLIGEAKAKEMNEKWEALFNKEAMLRKMRIALLSEIIDLETA